MKNIVNRINSKVMGVVNNMAERVGETAVTTCIIFGSYEVEIPLELINKEE